MLWQRKGDYGMISEPYRVAKLFRDGCSLYTLHFGDERLGWFNSFEECKEAAEAHAKKVAA